MQLRFAQACELANGRTKSNIHIHTHQGLSVIISGSFQNLTIGLTLIGICTGAFAETVVYKWVDEDGVVHFGDAPPEESVAAETLVIPKAPPAPAPTQPTASVPATSETVDTSVPVVKAEATPSRYERTDISRMSVADLNLRCDEARERMIAPLREAEIAKCKQDKREDPAFCERFNADYGDGGRTATGSIRPRMFDDLPECVEATKEINQRQR